ncbi:MAG: iron ABC transporter permease [archaeon]|nr:iron ABC transporter permease [archaeon]
MSEERNRIDDAVQSWLQREESDVSTEKLESYASYIGKKVTFILLALTATVLIAGYSLTLGAYPIAILDCYKTVFEHLLGIISDDNIDYVIFELRLPRICTGIIAGIGLAISGAVMQSILRNPLADPYTTGVSSGASFGATLAIILGLSFTSSSYAIVGNAFLFALIPMFAIMVVAKMKSASPTTMIMSGIAVMYIFNALTTIIKLYASPEAQAAAFAWSVGSIEGSSWEKVGVMFVMVLIGSVISQILARKLNVVATGDESARSIGVNPKRLRTFALLIVSVMTAGVVSVTGLIGFIGLVCPHIARIFIGSDNRYLIPASAAFGAALLLFADVVGRTIVGQGTLPVGVITAFIGGPMFLYLIIRQKKEAW